jgi:hypothetical protein
MTNHDLYAIYLAAYGEASHFRSGGSPGPAGGIASALRRMVSAARPIEDLARHDATNGTPPRSRAAFERALADGARVLQALAPGREAAA